MGVDNYLLKSVYKEKSIHQTAEEYTLGQESSRGVVKMISYNEADESGGTHYVDVEFESGNKIRMFKPDWIEYLVDEKDIQLVKSYVIGKRGVK